MKLRYAPRAEADIENIHRYLYQLSPSGALAVVTAIHKSIAAIAASPHSWPLSDFPAIRTKLVTNPQLQDFLPHRR